MKRETVRFDQLRNSFYRVDRETGIQQPAYRTGEPLKSFKPNVTGNHYLLRRVSQRQPPTSPPALPTERSYHQPPRFDSFHSAQDTFHLTARHHSQHYSTLETSRRDSKPSEPASPRRDSPKPSLSLLATLDQRSPQPSRDSLNQTLNGYSDLLRHRPSEHKSPRSQQIHGAEPPSADPLDTLCLTMAHFRPAPDPFVPPKTPTSHTPREKSPESEQVKTGQALKERALFLEFHPEWRPQVKAHSVEVQVQRKKNLLILEELFIRQNNRTTRKPVV